MVYILIMTATQEYIAELKAENVGHLKRIQDVTYDPADQYSVYRALGECHALAGVVLNNLESIANLEGGR